MVEWWNALSLMQQIFACLAIPATVVLIVQTILLLFGIGDGGADIDGGGMGADAPDVSDFDGAHTDVPDGSDSLSIFTLRGIIAFLAVGGWVGVLMGYTGVGTALSILIAFVAGLLALLAMALLLKAMLKLQDNGNVQILNAVGKTGRVYLIIPPKGQGAGKINVTAQERYQELRAITNDTQAIPTDAYVKVVGVVDTETVLVERI